MATSVKLSPADKEKLERVQALVTLKMGRKMTQQELLSAMISEALLRDDEFVKKISKSNLPINDEEFSRLLSLVEDWGVETRWEEVDQVLYGGKKGRRR